MTTRLHLSPNCGRPEAATNVSTGFRLSCGYATEQFARHKLQFAELKAGTFGVTVTTRGAEVFSGDELEFSAHHQQGQRRTRLLDSHAMLTIYGVYRSRASRTIWLANELGITFKHVPVMQHYRLEEPIPGGVVHTKSPEFLEVNPNGHIPSIDDDGYVLHESLAINLYLAKKHGGPLAPANIGEDGEMTMWTLWSAAEVEPHAINIIYHRVGNPSGIRDPKVADAAVAALRGPFAVLDKTLMKSGYVMGGRFTVADINVAEIVRYAQPAPELFEAAPNVTKWLAACQSRPAFKAMWAARDREPV